MILKLLTSLLFFLLFNNASPAQPLQSESIKVTSQRWAGGICCRSGVRYTIKFTLDSKKAENISIGAVCIDGRKFDDPKVLKTKEGKQTHFSLSFGYARDEAKYEGKVEESSFPSCNKESLHYTYNKLDYELKIDKIERLKPLAYP